MPGSRESRFWTFQAVFWVIAGAGLLISGLSQTTFRVAFVRNAVLFLAGGLTSFSLASLIDRLRSLPGLQLRLVAFPASYALAVLCTIAVNSITFVQLGSSWAEMSWRQWFAGAMNFGLVYALWTELYVQNILRPAAGRGFTASQRSTAGDRNTRPERLTVTRDGTLVPLELGDVSHVVAAGDYVEIHTPSRSYLERRTIGSLAAALPTERFLRVHRSVIVNVDRVEALTPLTKGRYRLELLGGVALESSRSYGGEIRRRWLAGL